MSDLRWPRVGASTGIVAAVLLALTFVFGPTDTLPGFGDSADQVANFVRDNRDELRMLVALQFGAAFFFAWFLGSVFFRLRAAEVGPARLSAAALGGGVLGIGGAVAGTAATGAATYHVETLDPNVVQGLWDLSVFAYDFALVGFAVLLWAAGALAFTRRALPRWLGAFSFLLAIYAFVVGLISTFSETGVFSPSDGVLGFVAFGLLLLWLLVTGIVLTREPIVPGTRIA